MFSFPRRRIVTTVAGLVLSATCASRSRALYQDFPPSDPQKDIAAALAGAERDGKLVLLDFGADWCVDCNVLERLFRDPSVAPFLAAHFHLVRIDLGKYPNGPEQARNVDVAANYGIDPIKTGIPALVPLDPRGLVVPTRGVEWSVQQPISNTGIRGTPTAPFYRQLIVTRHLPAGDRSETYLIGVEGGVTDSTLAVVARNSVKWFGQSLVIMTSRFSTPIAPDERRTETWAFDSAGQLVVTITEEEGQRESRTTLTYRKP